MAAAMTAKKALPLEEQKREEELGDESMDEDDVEEEDESFEYATASGGEHKTVGNKTPRTISVPVPAVTPQLEKSASPPNGSRGSANRTPILTGLSKTVNKKGDDCIIVLDEDGNAKQKRRSDVISSPAIPLEEEDSPTEKHKERRDDLHNITTITGLKIALLKSNWTDDELDYNKMKRVLRPDELIQYKERILQIAELTSMRLVAELFGVSPATLYLWKRTKSDKEKGGESCSNSRVIDPDDTMYLGVPETSQSQNSQAATSSNSLPGELPGPVASFADNSVLSLQQKDLNNTLNQLLVRLSKLERKLEYVTEKRKRHRKHRYSSDSSSEDESGYSSCEEKHHKRRKSHSDSHSELLLKELLNQLIESKNENSKLKKLLKNKEKGKDKDKKDSEKSKENRGVHPFE